VYGQAVFAARGNIARALDPGPGHPWRRDTLLLRRHPSRPRVVAAACCASVDRICADHLVLHMASTVRGCGGSALPSKSGPKPLGPFKCAPSLLAPGALSDALFPRRCPSRPRVATAACCLSVDRVCAGHLALHMASTVRGCGASPALPSDSGPNYWGPSSVPLPLAPGPLATRRTPPEEAPLKTMGSGRGLLSLGRPRLCRPFGLAHSLDRARLRRLSHLAFGLGIVPQIAGVFQTRVRKNGRGCEVASES
jgi:hypothetical protein